MIADPHPRQAERLAALRRLEILDTDREPAFDEVVELVSALCDVPIAVVNLIDADRQWFKAEVGLGVRSTPLDTSICSHIILNEGFVEISDTLADPRMRDNPLCAGHPGLRFYAGASLMTDDGLPLGTLCVLDYKPRTLSPTQRRVVEVMARQVMRQLELRYALRQGDMLRKEIDHRVKNSLASVGAMIALQVARCSGEEAKNALAAVQRRLGALASLHEELYRSGDGAKVDLKAFLERVTAMMAELTPDEVSIRASIDPASVSVDHANLVGIIVNEFCANSGKYAFPNGQPGGITIRGERVGDGYELTCSDDGVGMGDLSGKKGLGMRIINSSARSLSSDASWSSDGKGTRLQFSFPALAG
jgi:two-component sensor histidine kinase